MSSRYDPVDEKPVSAEPIKSPLEPVSKAGLYKSAAALIIVAAIGVAAAFGFDLCAFLGGVGVTLEGCRAPAAPATPEPAPAQ